MPDHSNFDNDDIHDESDLECSTLLDNAASRDSYTNIDQLDGFELLENGVTEARFLPPGERSDLYRLYTAICSSELFFLCFPVVRLIFQ